MSGILERERKKETWLPKHLKEKITKILIGCLLFMPRWTSPTPPDPHMKVVLLTIAIDGLLAYEQFAEWRLSPGESVDVYLAELQRLLVQFDRESDWVKTLFLPAEKITENIILVGGEREVKKIFLLVIIWIHFTQFENWISYFGENDSGEVWPQTHSWVWRLSIWAISGWVDGEGWVVRCAKWNVWST